jgi:hypothetical protein
MNFKETLKLEKVTISIVIDGSKSWKVKEFKEKEMQAKLSMPPEPFEVSVNVFVFCFLLYSEFFH